MSRALMLAVTGLAGVLTSGTAPQHSAPEVRLVPDVDLHDFAVAVYDPATPVIYYNPVLLNQVGPELRAFFLAHEYGHISFRHTRAGVLRAESGDRDSLFQEKELEADCYAARTLSRTDPAAVEAAIRLFSRMGNRNYDTEHPPGARRAARILSCLPQR
jgi:hypothetical protein